MYDFLSMIIEIKVGSFRNFKHKTVEKKDKKKKKKVGFTHCTAVWLMLISEKYVMHIHDK